MSYSIENEYNQQQVEEYQDYLI